MPLILGLLLFGIFATATVCLMLANFYFIQVYEETNGLLPQERKIPLWKAQWSAFTISREHRRLFPSSSKRRAMYVFTTIGIVLSCSFIAIVILMNLGKSKQLTVEWDKGEVRDLPIKRAAAKRWHHAERKQRVQHLNWYVFDLFVWPTLSSRFFLGAQLRFSQRRTSLDSRDCEQVKLSPAAAVIESGNGFYANHSCSSLGGGVAAWRGDGI